MNNRPFSMSLTSAFIILNALIWLALGIVIGVNAHPALPVSTELKWIMAILSVVIAGILVCLFIFLHRGSRIAFYLMVVLLGFVAFLTIFDDVGLSDIFVLVLNLIPIILLIKDRKWYLKVETQPYTSV